MIIFCGDIHGEIRKLVWELTIHHEIKDANVIIVGDVGMGFDDSFKNIYRRIEKRLEKNNIKIWGIRGNHDNPSCFPCTDYPLFELMEDHKVYEVEGKTIYPVGGAYSIDIDWRLEENKKLEARGSRRRVWWQDEGPKRKMDELPRRVDIIATHEAPLCFEPVLSRTPDCPSYQYQNIIDSRHYLDHIFREVTCDKWYFGHYHRSITGEHEGVHYRGLGIMELITLYV